MLGWQTSWPAAWAHGPPTAYLGRQHGDPAQQRAMAWFRPCQVARGCLSLGTAWSAAWTILRVATPARQSKGLSLVGLAALAVATSYSQSWPDRLGGGQDPDQLPRRTSLNMPSDFALAASAMLQGRPA